MDDDLSLVIMADARDRMEKAVGHTQTEFGGVRTGRATSGLVEHLRVKFAGETRLEIIHADVLSTDLRQWGPVPVSGNLPYYISSPILEKTIRLELPRAIFLIQKEVAERLVAKPGTR